MTTEQMNLSICPKCGGKTDTFRHPYAKVWCVVCNYTLREEGDKTTYLIEKETISIEQMNKEVVKWLGLCWHEDWYEIQPYVQYNQDRIMACGKCNRIESECEDNPDFSQKGGIIRLLEEMRKREDWERFSLKMHPIRPAVGPDWIHTLYIDDGKLLQAVWEWSKEHPR